MALLLLKGIDEKFDKFLGLSDREGVGSLIKYSTKSAAIELSNSQGRTLLPTATDSMELVKTCLDQIEANFEEFHVGTIPSSNWRWKPSLKIAARNESQEKQLEKMTAFWLGDEEWTNQMTVCNGMCGSPANRFGIDLVHRRKELSYDLIELKFADSESGGANNPLHAAFEILKYGLVYLLFRKRELLTSAQSQDHHILAAESIRLLVLAPRAWYCFRERGGATRPYEFAWLASWVTESLQKYVREFVPDITEISLCFEQLEDEFLEVYGPLTKAASKFRESGLGPRSNVYALAPSK